MRTVGQWSRLPREIVSSPASDVFKMRMDKALSYLVTDLIVDPALSKRLD